jgi:hypothetical protein
VKADMRVGGMFGRERGVTGAWQAQRVGAGRCRSYERRSSPPSPRWRRSPGAASGMT